MTSLLKLGTGTKGALLGLDSEIETPYHVRTGMLNPEGGILLEHAAHRPCSLQPFGHERKAPEA